MSPKIRQIIKAFFWSVCIMAFLALMFRTEIMRKEIIGTGVEVQFLDKNEVKFLNKSDISNIFNRNGLSFMNLKIDSINLTRVEEDISKNPFVHTVKAYHDLEGKVYVDLIQKVPVLRIIGDDYGYYLDEFGTKIPTSSKFTSKVITVQGFGLKSRHDEILLLWSKIKQNKLLKAQIVGIFVDREGEYIMNVQFGDFKVLLGGVDHLDTKLFKLEHTFRDILNTAGWEKYSMINLKFKDQVVCTKR